MARPNGSHKRLRKFSNLIASFKSEGGPGYEFGSKLYRVFVHDPQLWEHLSVVVGRKLDPEKERARFSDLGEELVHWGEIETIENGGGKTDR